VGILRRLVEQAAQNTIPFIGHDIVRNTHLDVVGFSGKKHDRLVLCLPAKLGNGSVVSADVESSMDF
jgi:hypothetical protein